MSDTRATSVLGAIDDEHGSDLVVRHSVDLARRHSAAELHFPPRELDRARGCRGGRTAPLIERLGQALKSIGDVPRHLRIIAHEAHGDRARPPALRRGPRAAGGCHGANGTSKGAVAGTRMAPA